MASSPDPSRPLPCLTYRTPSRPISLDPVLAGHISTTPSSYPSRHPPCLTHFGAAIAVSISNASSPDPLSQKGLHYELWL